jgi:hypothetical protein
MKTTLNSLVTMAAGVALSAAAAYGQTQLTAKIPFEFRTASGVQAAGEYRVSPVTHDNAVMRLQNVETGRSAVTGFGTSKPDPNEAAPQLVFKCGIQSGCSLAAVKMGDGRGWTYKAPKLRPSEQERIAVIYADSRPAAE